MFFIFKGLFSAIEGQQHLLGYILGIGAALLKFAVEVHHADVLWALEKNVRGIRFYERHGFHVTDEKIFEEGTTEYLVRLRRRRNSGVQV